MKLQPEQSGLWAMASHRESVLDSLSGAEGADAPRAGRPASRQLVVNGLALAYLDYGGSGQPLVLFLHGGSAHSHWWDFTAPAITTRFAAVALDQRGHGDSQWPSEWAYGSRHYVEDLVAVIEQLSPDQPVVLVGHSMGAHNAMLYAARNVSRVKALVVVDMRPSYNETMVKFLGSFAHRPHRRYQTFDEALANFRLLPQESMAHPAVLNHIARHSFRQEKDGLWALKFDRRTLVRDPIDAWPELPRITCPTLVMRAEKSVALTPELAKKMATTLPCGKLVEVPNCYHHIMLDNPAGFNAALGDFLGDVL